MLINTSSDESKEIVKEIKNRTTALKERIKKVSKTEKKIKMLMRHQRLLKKILNYKKNAQIYFQLASKVDKKIQNQRLKKVLENQ